jgi:arylsulfatase A-like enzyme
MRINFLFSAIIMATSLAGAQAARKPNIVYIMSDELAYYELSHMGNPYIKTPIIDRFAAEGIRFTSALAGAPVCAPLRCNLMTGKHAGHASVRANDGGTPLRAGEPTIASMLKDIGYATGGFGKWGCGGRDSTGVPEQHGFDVFYGYYDQVHAHSFYPPYLIRNSEEVKLDGNIGGRSGKTYSHYPIMEEGLKFIRENKDRPFFCYFPITPPHGMYDIPKDDPAWELYKGEKWIDDPGTSQDVKNYAAMVSMVDYNVGQVLDLLRELKLEGDTIVFFTGDNGGQDRFRSSENPRGFFGPNVNPRTDVEFRGGKGNLYEGGLRIPYLVRWPGKIKAGQVSDLIFYQPDVLPTLAQLSGAKAPGDIDGLSFLPTLLGGQQEKHDMLYWEFGSQTAVRKGQWKAIQAKKNQPWALYDLSKDISETTDVSAQHSDLLAQMKAFAVASHEPVSAGKYLDARRTRHEKDRLAKWGTSKPQPKAKRRAKWDTRGLIPQKGWKVVRVSSENRDNRKLATNAFDNDADTIWHSQFNGVLRRHPHELVIDLGQARTINGFRCLARQDNGWNGAIGDIEISVSGQADEFGVPVAKAKLKKTKAAQNIRCDRVKGQYVRIRALSEVNGGPWASMAEFGVIGK